MEYGTNLRIGINCFHSYAVIKIVKGWCVLVRLICKILFISLLIAFNPLSNGKTTTGITIQEDIFFDAHFDDQIVHLMQKGHISSLSACVVLDNELYWVKGYGEQAGTDLAYDIGSITKTFTATALLQLYEQGLFDLDEDVNRYLSFKLRNPHFPNDPITFRMLLTHTASFPAHDTPATIEILYSDLLGKLNLTHDEFPSFPEWIEEYVSPTGSHYSSVNWGEWRPGTQSAYSNVGYCILGYLLECLSNQTYGQYLSEHIFQPLNMSNTRLNYSEYNTASLANLYGWDSDEKMNIQYPHYSNDHYLGAVGLYTSVTDLAKYMIAHMNEGQYDGVQLLNASTIELMHSKQVIDLAVTSLYEHNSYFGLGWNLLNLTGDDFLQGHTGRTIGSTSMMFYYGEKKDNTNGGTLFPRKIGVITLINQGYSVLKSRDEILYSDSDSTGKEVFGLIAATASGKKSMETQSISFSFSAVVWVLGLLIIHHSLKRK
jgi:CubicO group peptidase (beta-lactamase class C family)